MQPYGVPNSKVVSGLKSNTHKGKGYNEFSMDDTAGKEKIVTHAQYDMETTVEHDKKVIVTSGNRTLKVNTGTNSETIKGNSSHTVQAGFRNVEITGGDYSACSTTAAANLTGKTSANITGKSAGVTVNGKGGSGVEIDGNGKIGVDISGDPNIALTAKTKTSI